MKFTITSGDRYGDRGKERPTKFPWLSFTCGPPFCFINCKIVQFGYTKVANTNLTVQYYLTFFSISFWGLTLSLVFFVFIKFFIFFLNIETSSKRWSTTPNFSSVFLTSSSSTDWQSWFFYKRTRLSHKICSRWMWDRLLNNHYLIFKRCIA